MRTDLIGRLAAMRGIGDAYYDYRGELRHFSLETKAGILRAMGIAVDDDAALEGAIGTLERSTGQRLLPPVAASTSHRIGVDIHLGAAADRGTLRWAVVLEDGSRQEGRLPVASCAELWRGQVNGAVISRRRFELPLELPAGYHRLEAAIDAGATASCRLIMAPARCHEPAVIAAGGRLWGVAVQLYTLRSKANWGIGDFADLEALVRWLAPQGAGFIGLNPLHALAPAAPLQASPYSASNRHFLNVLYIAVPAVPEFAGCEAVQRLVGRRLFKSVLTKLRQADHVDYAGVARVKLEALECLYTDFRTQHLARHTPRAAEFQAFVARGGEALQRHAQFDALDRHLGTTLGTASGWMNWPEEFRDSQGPAVSGFCAAHALDIEFFVYLQWLADQQLRAAQALARELGMPIGLYGDYAVGVSSSGSETWAERASYRLTAEIGAPPDPLALKGQGWGIPPQDPVTMQEERLSGFVSLISDNMRYYGAMRIDHVMSLFRLWWVPANMPATAGAYVHYPLHLLFAVVALESQRQGCLVVGEDLGVVPDEVRAAMPQYGLYHYKVMLFEKDGGRFRAPGEFLRPALATVTTHDLPPLRSYWSGLDITLREQLALYPSEAIRAQVRQERSADRDALLAALRHEGLAPPEPSTGTGEFNLALTASLHRYLARSSAALASLQLEDLLGMTDPVNVPGTSDEYPNWQRKMSAALEDFASREDLRASLAAVNAERR